MTKPGGMGSVGKEELKPVSPAAGKGVTAIGDSVMLDIEPYLEKFLPGIVIDGEVGRQMSQAKDIVAQLKANGKLGDVLLLQLGTNGTFSEKTLVSLLQSLEDVRQIVLVNTRVPRPWESDVNAILSKTAAKFSNVTLVDWYTASANKDTYFAPDGVHLGAEGAKAYASLVAGAVKPKQEPSKKDGK
ncbi:hypothetical protein ACFQ88_22725 [Paenibacillus sp. NPDC056579]|uniref:SGNH/GDSL hydrolase family protein n=1 Tax=Paenibacillus sp. NPDC056579 TaxID=3345871 RepID=UPI0036C34A87